MHARTYARVRSPFSASLRRTSGFHVPRDPAQPPSTWPTIAVRSTKDFIQPFHARSSSSMHSLFFSLSLFLGDFRRLIDALDFGLCVAAKRKSEAAMEDGRFCKGNRERYATFQYFVPSSLELHRGRIPCVLLWIRA